MRIRTIDAYVKELDDVALRSSACTFYHSRIWAESLAATFPRMSFRCIVAEQNGAVTGFLPFFYLKRGPVRTAWSMPFGTYGGPAALDAETTAALVEAYAVTLSAPRVVEAGWVDFDNFPCGGGWERQTLETHLIDTSMGFDALWGHIIERQRKKRARRAERLGVTVRRARSAADAHRYYEIYSQRVDEWGGGIRYPERLFEELLGRSGDFARLYVAEHDGSIVGGHFNFYYKEKVTAWNGITTQESNHLQPGTLLYMYCLKDACAEGYKVYNLGGSLNKQSLIDFKESLGGVPYSYSQYRRRSLLGRAAAWVKRSGE
jgi:CelD/BcsL family acetyltransferase involved in cellulose biosynthesis